MAIKLKTETYKGHTTEFIREGEKTIAKISYGVDEEFLFGKNKQDVFNKVKNFIDKLPKEKKEKETTLYTGTSSMQSDFILNEGLKTATEIAKESMGMSADMLKMSDQSDVNYTYFFTKPYHAFSWAKVVAQSTGGKPVVIEAKVDTNKIERDYNMPYGVAYRKKGGVSVDKLKEYKGDTSYPK